MTLVAVILRPLGLSRFTNKLAGRAMHYPLSLIAGIKYTVQGAEKLEATRPCVIVSNHQSTLDMVTMGRVFPSRCVVIGKKEILRIPFIGWFFYIAGNYAVDRKNHSSAMGTMGRVSERMKKEDTALWLYPEGTRSYFRTPDLLDFKKGAFRTAIDAQCPVIPVIFSVYTHVYDEKARRWPGGEVIITVLDPIPTTGLKPEDTQALLERTRNVMLETLRHVSGDEYRDRIKEVDVDAEGEEGDGELDGHEQHETEEVEEVVLTRLKGSPSAVRRRN